MAKLFLHKNECIDEDFLGKPRIQEMAKAVTSKCGFPQNLFDVAEAEVTIHLKFKCGQVSFGNGNAVGGTQAKKGQWPFLVSLHSIELSSHICGGNLITTKHVMTGKCSNHFSPLLWGPLRAQWGN